MAKSVHIILMGWDWDRALYGLKKYPAEKVIIIRNAAQGDPFPDRGAHTRKLSERLKKSIEKIFDVEIKDVNVYDYEESASQILDIFRENAEAENIYMNISSGPRPLTMAAAIAAQHHPVKLFYVVPAKYNLRPKEETISSGVSGLIDIPPFNIQKLVTPSHAQQKVLAEITEGITLTDLVRKYANKNTSRITNGKLRELKTLVYYHLKALKEKNLIETRKLNDGQLAIHLTPTGKFINKTIGIEKK